MWGLSASPSSWWPRTSKPNIRRPNIVIKNIDTWQKRAVTIVSHDMEGQVRYRVAVDHSNIVQVFYHCPDTHARKTLHQYYGHLGRTK